MMTLILFLVMFVGAVWFTAQAIQFAVSGKRAFLSYSVLACFAWLVLFEIVR